ncbi:NADH-quinone oxidoreductase subunit C/D, partial [candidate division KSB1 bacterium]|nr:NADH-quinone oxidoreductase subunit C/D [candidate division KSB1 bacterium]NIR70761.1 NADH-quinone oxidoreductase subunit C/D [candidate division KSB1 bacterium]NIS23214.1 NADH-quinone oxidoreductase subunit C/D [candidate division KSB1 bacterium]NIT70074.1 NADH-quinone oxidoreductase subunit C/D [candidate division KSB1 bacterium]NIU23711.1 NADH-quinone oxidoreductase subunit C/D [candidate division KSB1 bacterium]
MTEQDSVVTELKETFGDSIIFQQEVRDRVPTLWVRSGRISDILHYVKNDIDKPFAMLYDLTAIDERNREYRDNQPASQFTVVYHLLSFDRNQDLRLKVPLNRELPSLPSAINLWPTANWYEREVWDMFGIKFDGHPHLRRILMPQTWKGHPLRKEHPARATEMGTFELPDDRQDAEQTSLQFRPEEWGLEPKHEDTDFMFLNLGPQHPGTHGVLRIVLQLDGEEIVDAVPDIGFHHRGAEKMAERQTWHTYIPYTDRVDYLGGVMNNLAYVLAVEKLAGIEVPDRAKVIRVMLCELFRIASHLVWYGTFAQDVGAMSPVFYMFNDRERIFTIIEAICGDRMHPNWFRIGGLAQDLPDGWNKMVQDYLDYMPKRLKEYDVLVMKNRIFKGRTVDVGAYTKEEAIEWGVTGPGLRACGFEWDFRKKRPYSGYDQFEFDIPTATKGDCYDRGIVRVEEMRQSLRIIQQCVDNMPEGHYKSDHALTTPPRKDRTMHDIETLINHFLNVTWGPVIPAGEAFVGIEATKGNNGYYLISDGGIHSYRTRIRAPSFP